MTRLRDTVGVREDYINATEGHRIADTSYEDAGFRFMETTGELYRYGVREYGRCTGKVWVDCSTHARHHVGWVFQGREKYEDSDETYLREVWLGLYETIDGERRPFYIDAPDHFQGC